MIEIELVDGKYIARVSPPHGTVEWESKEPLTVQALDAKLHDLGCHATDISDAFYAADPGWVQGTED